MINDGRCAEEMIVMRWHLPLLRPLSTMLLASVAAAPAAAQNAAALQTRALAATCANCHGTEGRALADAAVPGLAGMPALYMTEQMKSFKAGTRPATVMHQLAKGYSDAQIDQVAAYFAALKK